MPPFDAAIDAPAAASVEHRPAHALWFGPTPLFGWFHPARTACARDAVVVLCAPFGYDTALTHHAHQKLAERLADAGVATLRFDYAGTGDSAGDEEEPGRVAAWLESLDAAVLEARHRSGASRVILFGARLGALLALAHAERSPVDGLVLLGPPRSGASFVRELRAFNALRAAQPAEGASPDIEHRDDEHLGHALSEQLRADLARLDPRRSVDRPAARAMVIARDDLPGPEVGLVQHLRGAGVDVEHSLAPGYADMFDYRALPPRTIDEILAWLPAEPLRHLARPRIATAAESVAAFDGVTEEAVRFDGMFGIVTRPASAAAAAATRKTGILLLGAGAHPHVGIHRMHVGLARALARLGFPVLRFDLSGIGESPALSGEPERRFYTDQAVPETRRAIDFMIGRGCKDVALAGLCSGGYTAFHTAVVDRRVKAIMPINVPGFRFNLADEVILAMNRPGLRWRIPSALVGRWLASKYARRAERPLPPHARGPLRNDRDDVARAFGTLVARGCRTLVVYGSGDDGLPVLERHLGPRLAKTRDDRALDLALVDGCDHTFKPRIAQRRLHALMTRFFDEALA